eukprot:g41146.t1
MHTKNKKLEKLGNTTNNNQVSPGTTVEGGTTTGKSIVNLSDHTFQPNEIKVLSRGLNFCPNTKIVSIGLTAHTEEFIRQMSLQEFFQDVSSKPNETTNEPDLSTERSMGEQAKKESFWTPLEGHCPGLDRYAQAIRECVNARLISRTRMVVQNITQAQRNAICALKTNCNIVIKPADKGEAIVMQNRTDHCKEVYRQLNNQEHYRRLPADPIKEHTHQLNRPVKTFLIQSFRVPYALSSHLLTVIPHNDGIAATASVFNINNCQFQDAILQLICFILNHNIFSFDNQFFIQTHGTAKVTRFPPQDRHLSTSLYCKPMDNVTMLNFSSFHPKHIKIAIPYGQALCIHRTCSDEEERDGHLKVLKDALI